MENTMKCKVSVLIPTLGDRKQELIRLLDSLSAQNCENMEVVVVSQGNHALVKDICSAYLDRIDLKTFFIEKKGLSLARNAGMQNVSGDVLLLADDDCWYDINAVSYISGFFGKNPGVDILLTQIYDPDSNELYKKYPVKKADLTSPKDILSKSSIEIAVRMTEAISGFDETFGLGARYVSGEDNDFLIRALKNKKHIHYEPVVTVFHRKKQSIIHKNQLIAKGALYSKHFGFLVSNLVLLRDLLVKHQNNYKWFWKGYFDYKKFRRSENKRR